MKKIIIKNVEFEYNIEYSSSEFGGTYKTTFYKGTKTLTYKKYVFFGKQISIELPQEIFSVLFNIEDPKYSKEFVKKRVEYAFDGSYGKEARMKEINEGNII